MSNNQGRVMIGSLMMGQGRAFEDTALFLRARAAVADRAGVSEQEHTRGRPPVHGTTLKTDTFLLRCHCCSHCTAPPVVFKSVYGFSHRKPFSVITGQFYSLFQFFWAACSVPVRLPACKCMMHCGRPAAGWRGALYGECSLSTP